jgi:hypothetical protein
MKNTIIDEFKPLLKNLIITIEIFIFRLLTTVQTKTVDLSDFPP